MVYLGPPLDGWPIACLLGFLTNCARSRLITMDTLLSKGYVRPEIDRTFSQLCMSGRGVCACTCVCVCVCTCVCACSTTQVCVDAVILNFLSVCVDIKRGWLKRATSSVSDFPYATSDGGNQENGIWKGNPCRGLRLFVPVYQIYPPSVSTDFIYLHITFDDLISCMPASSKLCMVCVQNVCNL